MNFLKKYKKECALIVLLPIFIVLLDHVWSVLGFYRRIENFDSIMHFSGGIVIAFCFILLLRIAQQEKKIGKINLGILFIVILGLVALSAVSWEFYEYLLDIFSPAASLRQPSVADTMGDLFMGLVGGSVGFLIAKIKVLKDWNK